MSQNLQSFGLGLKLKGVVMGKWAFMGIAYHQGSIGQNVQNFVSELQYLTLLAYSVGPFHRNYIDTLRCNSRRPLKFILRLVIK